MYCHVRSCDVYGNNFFQFVSANLNRGNRGLTWQVGWDRLLMEDVQPLKIKELLKRKPLEWRKIVVKTVCSVRGTKGDNLRKLWQDIYQGDNQWGVKDARFRAKEANWPASTANNVTHKKDCNSWIAGSIRNSLITEERK